jgi:hypothetical protein
MWLFLAARLLGLLANRRARMQTLKLSKRKNPERFSGVNEC